MSRNKLASKIAKVEAGKSEVEIGNVRSVLKHEVNIMAQEAVINGPPQLALPSDSPSFKDLEEAVMKEIQKVEKKLQKK